MYKTKFDLVKLKFVKGLMVCIVLHIKRKTFTSCAIDFILPDKSLLS